MATTPRLSRRMLILGALSALPALPAPALAANGKRVTILGDSITAGLGLPGRDSLPIQLQEELRRIGTAAVVRGAGVSGDTTAGGLGRLDYSVQPGTAVCVVALGANDLLRGLDPKTTRNNLDRIIRRLKQRHIGVVLAGISAPRAIGSGYARDFNAIFPSLAKEHEVALYRDLLAGVAGVRALNQADGIHPNARGVKLIVKGLAPIVARELAKIP